MLGILKTIDAYLFGLNFKNSNQTVTSGTPNTMESHSKVHLKKYVKNRICTMVTQNVLA